MSLSILNMYINLFILCQSKKKKKMHGKRLRRQGRLYSSFSEQGREARMQSDLNCAETNVGEFITVENLDLNQR